MFFGCRNALHDYLYEDEWKRTAEEWFLCRKECLWRNRCCISASTQNEKKKYVQNRITDEEKRVWSFLEAGAKIFVAGAAEKVPQLCAKTYRKLTFLITRVSQRKGKFDLHDESGIQMVDTL